MCRPWSISLGLFFYIDTNTKKIFQTKRPTQDPLWMVVLVASISSKLDLMLIAFANFFLHYFQLLGCTSLCSFLHRFLRVVSSALASCTIDLPYIVPLIHWGSAPACGPRHPATCTHVSCPQKPPCCARSPSRDLPEERSADNRVQFPWVKGRDLAL
jgi:hypothetical protein